jgi:hypothetical protein
MFFAPLKSASSEHSQGGHVIDPPLALSAKWYYVLNQKDLLRYNGMLNLEINHEQGYDSSPPCSRGDFSPCIQRMCLATQTILKHLETIELLRLRCPHLAHGHDTFMSRSSFAIAQCTQDLPQKRHVRVAPFLLYLSSRKSGRTGWVPQ